MSLANHYLFEPVACTPAAGWEKGQIENQVGNIREWLFTPCAKFETLDDLNRWLKQRCHELSARQHPDFPSLTIAECYQQEQPLLRQITTPFAGYVEHLTKVSRTCLVRVDRNQYSTPAQWSGKVVSARYTRRLVWDQMKAAKFPIHRDLVKFDWNEASFSRQQVEQLSTAGFMDDAHNLILVGDTGTGKTHLATALGVAAIHHGKRIRFFNAVDLVNLLEQEKQMSKTGNLVRRLVQVDAIILDELGYLPFPETVYGI